MSVTVANTSSPDRWRMLWIVSCAVLVGAAASIGMTQPVVGIALGSVIGVAVGIFLFFHPRIAFLLLVFFAPTRRWWTEDLHILPPIVRFADEAILAIIVARVLCDRLRAGRMIRKTPWDLSFFVFLFAGAVSIVVNHVPYSNALAGLRAPLLYSPILFVLANGGEHFDSDYLHWIWRCLLVLATLQILTALYQYPTRGIGADSLTGTMGPNGANDLGVFLLPFLMYLLSRKIDSGEGGIHVIGGIAVLFVTMVLCGSRAAWFVMLATAFLLWGRRLRRGRVIVLTAAILGVAFFVVTRIILLQGAVVAQAVGYSGVYLALFDPSSGGGQFAYYPVVWKVMHMGGSFSFFGLGPGMVSSAAAVQQNAPIYRNILYDHFGQTRLGLSGGVGSQILATGGEFGPIGLIALLSIPVIFARLAFRAHRRSEDASTRALAAGAFATAVGILMLAPIRNACELPTDALAMWLPGSILYARLLSSGAIPMRSVPASGDPTSRNRFPRDPASA